MRSEEQDLAIEDAKAAMEEARSNLEKAEQILLDLSTEFYLAFNQFGVKTLIAISSELEPKVDPRRETRIEFGHRHFGMCALLIGRFDEPKEYTPAYPNDKTVHDFNGDYPCLYRASHSREALQEWLDNESEAERNR